MGIIFGFDTSSSITGWAMFKNKKYLKSGVIKLPAKKAKDKFEKPAYYHYLTPRLTSYRNGILHILSEAEDTEDIDKVVLEDLVFKFGKNSGSIYTISLLSMYFGLAVEACQSLNLKIVIQPPNVTRQKLGLSGKVEKEEVLTEIQLRVPETFNLTDNNELDAIALALTNL